MTDNKIQSKGPQTAEHDPIAWGALALIVATASLVLSLEQKIKTRQRDVQRDRQQKAANGNRLRVHKLQTHITTLRTLTSDMRASAEIITDHELSGILRETLDFLTDENEERYQRIVEEVGNVVGRINRLICEMDQDGFPLSEEDIGRYVARPISLIADVTPLALDPDMDAGERFDLVNKLLALYENFLEDLFALLMNDRTQGSSLT